MIGLEESMKNNVGGMRLGWPFFEKHCCVLGINTRISHVIKYTKFPRGALDVCILRQLTLSLGTRTDSSLPTKIVGKLTSFGVHVLKMDDGASTHECVGA